MAGYGTDYFGSMRGTVLIILAVCGVVLLAGPEITGLFGKHNSWQSNSIQIRKQKMWGLVYAYCEK